VASLCSNNDLVNPLTPSFDLIVSKIFSLQLPPCPDPFSLFGRVRANHESQNLSRQTRINEFMAFTFYSRNDGFSVPKRRKRKVFDGIFLGGKKPLSFPRRVYSLRKLKVPFHSFFTLLPNFHPFRTQKPKETQSAKNSQIQ
jgi:hypothetical protein